MQKILIFSLAYYPRVGGAEVAIKEITDRVRDIEFHMITMRFSAADAADEKVGNVFVHRVGRGGTYLDKILFAPRAARAAQRLHRKERFDALWAMMSYMLFPIVLARVHLPYVLTLQEGDSVHHMFGRLRILPMLPLLRTGFKRARVVQAISTYLGGWARTRGFTGPLEIVPNGVDTKRFAGAAQPHEGVVLVTTSRLVRKNAVDIVIRSLPFLPKQVRFEVLGVGPDEEMLRALAKEEGVEGRVHFAGHIDHAELPAHLHNADIFVRPSRSEGMGNSFVEAMAAELPVIATTEGGLADFIKPEVAWPVPTESPNAVADAVQRILSNPEQTKKVVENARKLAFEKYDWDLIAKQMREKVFARVLES